MMRHVLATLSLASIVVAGVAVTDAQAGAFQLNERSTKAVGASLAGSVSAASDVTFASFNPAALTTVENFEVGGSFSVVAPISDGTTQSVIPAFNGVTYDADRIGYVPAFALGYRITDNVVLGLTSYSPFGLKTEYETLPAIADARTSELRTIIVAPTIAVDVLDNLTLGGSLDILYADARLTSAAVNLDGSTTKVGASAGLLWRPVDGTQIGAAFHSGYNLSIGSPVQSPLFPPGLRGDVTASLPLWLQFGVTQDVTEDLRVMFEGRWFDWSDFDRILVTTPIGVLPADVQNYQNSWFISGGAEYDITEQFTIRGGIAWDQTPTQDAFRTPRVPDEDRLWLSVGGSYAFSDSISLDLSYSYLYALNDPVVTLRNVPGTRIKYDGGAHIFSVGGAIKF